MIKGLKGGALTLWWETSGELLNKGSYISISDKVNNEKNIENFRKDIFETLQNIPEDDLDKEL